MVDEINSIDPLRFDPKYFPKCIDLEVPEEVLAYLQRIRDRTGRSISEIAAGLDCPGS